MPAVGEARVDSTQSEGAGKEGAGKEGAGKEGAGKEGAGKEAVLFSASEQGPAVFSQQDLDTVVDLRVFMDPAPHTISELAPMCSVYHMFNQVRARARVRVRVRVRVRDRVPMSSVHHMFNQVSSYPTLGWYTRNSAKLHGMLSLRLPHAPA